MNENQIEIVRQIVTNFSNIINLNDEQKKEFINQVTSLKENDAIDLLIVQIHRLLENKRISEKDVFDNINLLTKISEKYKTKEDILARYEFLKSMNMLNTSTPLEENHEIVLEAFDMFNELIGTDYDAYYTGGLMGYIKTNHELERYHGDLDLFINEDELEDLYKLVRDSDSFEFISNMDDKEENGHEFKIQYNGTPMSIGLFLFERKDDGEIVIKEYYHKDNKPENELLVNEQHLLPEYANLVFSENIGEYNGKLYKMQSLESIYNVKKNSRPKDKYDANIIKDYVDLSIDSRLDELKKENYQVKGNDASYSIVAELEEKINNKESIKSL